MMTCGGRIVFETDRLVVRLATVDDLDLFHGLWTNPRVMVHVGFPAGLRVNLEDLAVRLSREDTGEFDRLLVVALKSTGESIGQCIGECMMSSPDDQGIITTDVKLLPQFWGKRYGVEIKRALLDHAFARTDCAAVEATPNVANAASIRMQEAVGGVRIAERTHEFPESMRAFTTPVHHYVYRIDRATWEGRGGGSPPGGTGEGGSDPRRPR